MALIYQEGSLEAEQVLEDLPDILKGLNIAAEKHNMFVMFTDYAGRDAVFNITNITKITEGD